MPKRKRKFIVNGRRVTVDIEDDVRMLWVLRDVLNIRGPKYGCGINVCKACTSHYNGRAFNPCSVPVSKIKPNDEITTIEGLADTAPGKGLHPMQQAWLDHDVAQCGYCQPGQIMAAVDLVKKVHAEGRDLTDEDIDTQMRNVCRCGTYYRIRQAMKDGAERMKGNGRPPKGNGPGDKPPKGNGPGDKPPKGNGPGDKLGRGPAGLGS